MKKIVVIIVMAVLGLSAVAGTSYGQRVKAGALPVQAVMSDSDNCIVTDDSSGYNTTLKLPAQALLAYVYAHEPATNDSARLVDSMAVWRDSVAVLRAKIAADSVEMADTGIVLRLKILDDSLIIGGAVVDSCDSLRGAMGSVGTGSVTLTAGSGVSIAGSSGVYTVSATPYQPTNESIDLSAAAFNVPIAPIVYIAVKSVAGTTYDINLPDLGSSYFGYMVVVTDMGAAGTNNITINPHAGVGIESESGGLSGTSYVISANYGSVTLMYYTTTYVDQWVVIAKN